LTVDKCISFSDTKGIGALHLLSVDFFIVEIKFASKEIDMIKNIMSSFPARQIRFSKYLSAITKLKSVSY